VGFRCDFHIHSCLSPCGSLDMSPAAVARAAKAAGLDAAALADHHCARNAPAFAAACRREGLRALHGVEACSAEGIHVLALFDTPEAVGAFGDLLFDHLPDVPNDPLRHGDQAVVDEHDNVLELVPRHLGGATDLPFARLPGLVADHGGLFIPAHVDRPAGGLLARTGVVPPEAGPVLEATPRGWTGVEAVCGKTHVLVAFSDAHRPADIGRAATRIDADEFTLSALRDALLARRLAPLLPA